VHLGGVLDGDEQVVEGGVGAVLGQAGEGPLGRFHVLTADRLAQHLAAEAAAGRFRLDLYYRLSVIPLHVPPLRERTECILPTLRHHVELFAERVGVRRRLSRAACEALLVYPWPGNVRELINLCERLVVMTDAELIDVSDLPPSYVARDGKGEAAADGWSEDTTLDRAVEITERALLLRAKERFGNQALMAKALGINQSTVARKMKKYGLS
jgi:DNA-binding NtrC family response regulator